MNLFAVQQFIQFSEMWLESVLLLSISHYTSENMFAKCLEYVLTEEGLVDECLFQYNKELK